MAFKTWCIGVFLAILFVHNRADAQLVIADNSTSGYKIVIPVTATRDDQLAASTLKQYLFEISGAALPIITDAEPISSLEICIGKTNRTIIKTPLINNDFLIKTIDKRLVIYAESSKGDLHGVYHFLDKYLGCRKYTSTLKYIPKQNTITINTINDLQKPPFEFRGVYYPAQYDAEYRDWHKLNLIEDDWGLWGHTFDKLVPSSQYFKAHPEYYALVNGERNAGQLCLSNPQVYKILMDNLTRLISEQPEKKYWSVSQNDGPGHCTCHFCSEVDKKYGGPQGSIILFVNKVAKNFPGKTISTMAYLYSKHPTVNLKPIKNVSIMLSSIDMNRAKPIATDPGANSFRNDMKGWVAISNSVMVWDYVVQFTNYLSPFPNMQTLQANLNYFAKSGIKGVFSQGTENSVGEFSDLKTYLLSRLSWQPGLNVTNDMDDFMQAYYGKAAAYIKQYQQAMQAQLQNSNRVLDIYGEPTSEWRTWLTPQQIDEYSAILDKAESMVSDDPKYLTHILQERLPLEYVVLQQARFYGLEKHGMFVADGNSWSIRPGFENKVDRFIKTATSLHIKQLNEDGLTVDDYATEWKDILTHGPLLHLAVGKPIIALTPFNTEYPGKNTHTLTDGGRGYNNFQYNYLGWYGRNMQVVVDLDEVKNIKTVIVGFLEDQRHWAFLPLKITIEVSTDNSHFYKVGEISEPVPEENYSKQTHRIKISLAQSVSARYIKLTAQNLKTLPPWRNFPNRKPWLFCDEIEVYN